MNMNRRMAAVCGIAVTLVLAALYIYHEKSASSSTPASCITDGERPSQEDLSAPAGEGQLITLAGEDALGSRIEICGEVILLPPDVMVNSFIVVDEMVSRNQEYRVHLPYYSIQRGDSILKISQATGFILEQSLAPGDQDAFDFLQAYVKGVVPQRNG